MIAGWLSASTHSVAGGANPGVGTAATARASARTGAPGTGPAANPASRATSAPVTTPSPVMLYGPGGPAATMHSRNACPTSASWMNCTGSAGAIAGIGTGNRPTTP